MYGLPDDDPTGVEIWSFFRFYDNKSAIINTRMNNMKTRQAMYV